ncbi:protein DEFECTIVE IN MERISTEM SILENCING 3-like isoform X1 [Senna tora]|uniref:Protein DEFECTIVE IN MERISTEM SILENCING 3-like isoform X1 n=1 Tax=Senna tora TaxID=362788 RepID=A0A834WKF3_9FABA|nr:protein DEFECTIVE IN MERISTEM SILENCING 3-like isoform X1 [Senna tora]
MSEPNDLNLKYDRESLQNKILKHEDNLKFLTSERNRIDEAILDLQVSLGRYHSANVSQTENGNGAFHAEEKTVQQILKKENSAAGVLCWLKSNTLTWASDVVFTKDVVGVVASLARVDSDDLSRMFSEYLGLETMLAIVCKTREGINALEKYEADGTINPASGLHGLGSSIGKKVNGRFVVICTFMLVFVFSPFIGGVVANDPQKKLNLPKPKSPDGDSPAGFIDYAVNMINLDSKNLSYLTADGYGLRETLFYRLFSRLQVYRTRKEMLLARPCITDGALSLDGGMIKKCGVFAFGPRKEAEVKFPVTSGESDGPSNYAQAEDMARKLRWESSKLAADIQREQELLDRAKADFMSQA